MTFIRRQWAQISTKLGLVLTAVATVAPQFASFDQRIAWAGAAAGVLLIVFQEKPGG